MLKRIVQNKYKLMALIIGLYLLVDVLQHKGQTRILFPKAFPAYKMDSPVQATNHVFINKDKDWKKAVNTREQLNDLDEAIAGFEVDVYFDTAGLFFDVYHDAGKSTGLRLEELLAIYKQRKLDAGIWLDIKNLDEKNVTAVLTSLIQLRKIYGLQNKLIVESPRVELLTDFTDSLFFTSFYIPMFNPYRLNDEETKKMVAQIAGALHTSRVNALSGYYFQFSFLQHYFPKYPMLTWADKDPFSLVNLVFRKKIEADRNIFIILYTW